MRLKGERLFIVMKVDGECATDFDRSEETVIFPPTTRYIGQCACFNAALTSLCLESSHIIKIEEYAFSHCHQLMKVVFPTCLQEICEGAFFACENLEIINFGQRSLLKKIGPKAFLDCNKLKLLKFPPFLEIIGHSAFSFSIFFNIDLRFTKIRQIGSKAFKYESNVLLPATVTPKSIINCCHFTLNVARNHPVVCRDECGCLFVNGTIIKAKKETRHFLIRRGVERIGKYCFHCSQLVSLAIPSSVTKISRGAISDCKKLKHIYFTKDSRLNKIGKRAFAGCSSLKKIKFPKSLKFIKTDAFLCCFSLKYVSFPNDSQLERIEKAFPSTNIKHLSLPPSIREIDNLWFNMETLKSVHVRNEHFASNEEGTAIFSQDGRELICSVERVLEFQIPEGVSVIRRNALLSNRKIHIPTSVEVIEEGTFGIYDGFDCTGGPVIEFAPGSKLRSLDFEAFVYKPESFIINNENFVTMDNGVVVSLNPLGIVFVPEHLTEIEIDPNVEVIYSWAFALTKIDSLHFPKSLKKIFSHAFSGSKIRSITFEEGNDLETLGRNVFERSCTKSLHFPKILKKILSQTFISSNLESLAFEEGTDLKTLGESVFIAKKKINLCFQVEGKKFRYTDEVLKLPPNLSPTLWKKIYSNDFSLKSIICPRSSLMTIVNGCSKPYKCNIRIISDDEN